MTTINMKKFKPLYHQNDDGSIQQWEISVSNNTITRKFGRYPNGKITETSDTIHDGKNIGKVNETSPQEQAIAEAQSTWEKKMKSGYVISLEDAQNNNVDTGYVAGGVEPMLAQKWSKHSAKIEFPAFMQPKLDGIRCIATIHKGKCNLWSRTRKPINSVPHIVKALEEAFPNQSIILDGELYNHKMKDEFEEIVSLVRKDDPDPRCIKIQYHIYDFASSSKGIFTDRNEWLQENLPSYKTLNKNGIFGAVETIEVQDTTEAIEFFNSCRKQGYEGAMIRNADGVYENKRSYNLQKIKTFDDAEFKIIGVESGRGRMSECAIFVCETKKGDEFRCKMEGSLDVLAAIHKAPKKVIGKQLSIRYQGLTNGGVPRFPVGIIIRDYD